MVEDVGFLVGMEDGDIVGKVVGVADGNVLG